jgi:Xaa-Pro dipeptidase
MDSSSPTSESLWSIGSITSMTFSGGGIAKYNAKAHVRRFADALDNPAIILILQGERKANYSGSDQPRHFRQDRYFYYITGCNEPDCYVTYDIPKDHLTLWLPQTDLSRVFYDGRGSTPEEAMAIYDIDEARYITTDLVQDTPEATMIKIQVACYKDNGKSRTVVDASKLKSAMDDCRAVKDSEEIDLIREANRISSEAHRQVLRQLSRLETEAEVEGLFLNACIRAGAKEQAYSPIVGSGSNAGFLHYIGNDEAFDDRQVLLVDASCEWQLYAADITRTMPLNKTNPGCWPSHEAESIYKAVEKIQEECIRMLKPGQWFIDVNWHAIHMTIDALLDLGVLKGDHMEIFHNGTVTAFFPHGLGHHIGLEVHDAPPTRRPQEYNLVSADDIPTAYRLFAEATSPRYSPLPGYDTKEHFPLSSTPTFAPCTLASPRLKPGNVVTIEPGIYFNKVILDNVYLSNPKHTKFIDLEVLGRYMPVGGVRIEDDILITEDGFENLTPAVKGEEMLAVIREGDVDR